MAASVLTMGVGLVQSFDLEVQTTGGGSYCQHNISGNDGIGTFCSNNECKTLTGQGSNVGQCGTW